MRIDLDFVDLGNDKALFLADTNFGTKLYSDPKRSQKGALEMWYDTELRHTIVVYKNNVAIIERTASKTLTDPNQIGIKIEKVLPKIVPLVAPSVQIKAQASGPGIGLKQTAQVSTPMDKVQGKPGRKAKYQGEESQGE